jgi:hypothetical protein
MTCEKFVDLVKENGIENCMFIVPMKPIRSVFGIINYTSSSDPDFNVPCKLNEKRYKLDEMYKVTLESIYPTFGQQHYYMSDLMELIKDNQIELYIKHQKQ